MTTTTMPPRRRLAAVGAAALLAGGLVACGDDEESAPSATTEPAVGQTAPPPQPTGAATSTSPAETNATEPTQAEGLSGGETVLRLGGTAGRVLDAAGIELEPVAPAQRSGDAITFPISGGEVGSRFDSGRIDHDGGLRFTAGGRSVEATELVIEPADEVLTAQVEGRRVPLLSLELPAQEPAPGGADVRVRGAQAGLSTEALRALGDQLDVRLPSATLPLGEVDVTARR